MSVTYPEDRRDPLTEENFIPVYARRGKQKRASTTRREPEPAAQDAATVRADQPVYARRPAKTKSFRTWMILAPVGVLVVAGAAFLMTQGGEEAAGPPLDEPAATAPVLPTAPALSTPATTDTAAAPVAATPAPAARETTAPPTAAPVSRAAPAERRAAPAERRAVERPAAAPVRAPAVQAAPIEPAGPRPYSATPSTPAPSASAPAPAPRQPNIATQPLT